MLVNSKNMQITYMNKLHPFIFLKRLSLFYHCILEVAKKYLLKVRRKNVIVPLNITYITKRFLSG